MVQSSKMTHSNKMTSLPIRLQPPDPQKGTGWSSRRYPCLGVCLLTDMLSHVSLIDLLLCSVILFSFFFFCETINRSLRK